MGHIGCSIGFASVRELVAVTVRIAGGAGTVADSIGAASGGYVVTTACIATSAAVIDTGVRVGFTAIRQFVAVAIRPARGTGS